MDKIRSDYQFVYDSISGYCRDDSSFGEAVTVRNDKDSRLMALISTLESNRVAQVEKMSVCMYSVWASQFFVL